MAVIAATPAAEPPALAEGRPTPAFCDGAFSCASCGLGMREPCEHWKELLANSTPEPERSVAKVEAELIDGLLIDGVRFAIAPDERLRSALLVFGEHQPPC